MIKIKTADYKRVFADSALTLYNLLIDIATSANDGYGVYYCPSDFLATDNIGSDLLVKNASVIQGAIGRILAETHSLDILLILPYVDCDHQQKCCIIQKGKLLYNGVVPCYLHYGKYRFAVCDVNDKSTHFLSDAHIVFLVGSIKSVSDNIDVLKNHILSISKSIHSAVLYSSINADLSFESDVYENICLNTNYYELSDDKSIVDVDMLDYHKRLSASRLLRKSLVSKANTNLGFEIADISLDNLVLSKEQSVLRFGRFPLIDMENGCLEKYIDLIAANVANRALAINSHRLILGLSGGLDSTATLIIASRAIEVMRKKFDDSISIADLIAVSMPCFGTSNRTLKNSRDLAKAIGCTYKEINIKKSVNQHFSDIGHDKDNTNVVYENAQARARTQVLLDMANELGALQLGTGDLSESILGWCTFAGDQISMFNTNLSLSKTQLQAMLRNYSQHCGSKSLSKAIDNVLSTDISPELLPLDVNGNIVQKTENTNGPYEIVDLLIYLYFYRGWDIICCRNYLFECYAERFEKTDLNNWVENFERRFLFSHFKRATSAQSPIVTKIGEIVVNYDMSEVM